MARGARIEDALAVLGRVRSDEPEPRDDHDRKRGIKALLFGDVAPPRRIGRFIDLGLLGHGAMGTVRRAYDERLAREVAIKLVRRGSKPEHHERLLREAQALARLSHPNVVQVYEVGEFGAQVFIAMELVDGQTLQAWQREEHSWSECLQVYVQAGRGLAAAHAAGMIHRDFKPANCIRDTEGRVRVLDFGLARAKGIVSSESVPLMGQATSGDSTATTVAGSGAGASSSLDAAHSMLDKQITAHDAVVGTIAYMAPEQFVGRSIDARSDQFSFCVALAEALFGAPPFSKDPRRALIALAGGLERRPEFPPSPASRGLPRAVRDVLRRGLAGDPKARWRSMDALLRALEGAVHARARRRTMLTGVAVAVAALATSAGQLDTSKALAGGADPCSTPEHRLDDVWGQPQRERVHQALLATGVDYADETWRSVERQLGDRVRAWERLSVRSCEVEVARSPDPLRQRCLRRTRDALGDAIGLLSEADAKLVEHASSMVEGLPRAEDCVDASEGLRASLPKDWQKADELHRTLDHARTLQRAHRYAEGLSVAAEAVALAEALDHPPLLAEALLVEGGLRMDDGDPGGAEQSLDRASTIALESDDDALVVETKSLLAQLIGHERGRTEEAEGIFEWLVPFANRTRVSPKARATAWTKRGTVSYTRGDYAHAREYYQRALSILEDQVGDDHLQLVEPLDGLAMALRAQGKLRDALEHRERALSLQVRWLGPNHPMTGLVRSNLAVLYVQLGELPRGRDAADQALRILEGAHGRDHVKLANLHNTLGDALWQQGELSQAEEHQREALRIWEDTYGATNVSVVKVRLNLAALLQAQGKTASAIDAYTAVLRDLERSEVTPQTVKLVGQAWQDLGVVYAETKRPTQAEAHYRRGIAHLEAHQASQTPMMATLRNRLGSALLERGDARGAEAQHLQALEIYERLGEAGGVKWAWTRIDAARALVEQQQLTRAEDYLHRALDALADHEEAGRAPIDEARALLRRIERAR